MKAQPKHVTMKDIADKAGVSQTTVSRVLSNHPSVTPQKRREVMLWVKKLNFQPNYAARVLTASKSQLIGVMLPDLQNPYFTEILFHLERICAYHGYNILVANSNGEQQREKSIIRALKARQIDGLLVGVAHPESEIVAALREDKSLPKVVITQEHEGIDCVAVSHEAGGKLAAEYFLDTGVNEFVFFGTSYDPKFLGYNKRLRENGVESEKIHVIGNEDWFFQTKQRAYRVLSQYLRSEKLEGKTGVYCVGDIYAVGVIQAALDLKMRIPEDISIVGFDNIFICDAVTPRLTSISQPIEQIAESAVDILLRQIDSDDEAEAEAQHVVFQPELIRRDT